MKGKVYKSFMSMGATRLFVTPQTTGGKNSQWAKRRGVTEWRKEEQCFLFNRKYYLLTTCTFAFSQLWRHTPSRPEARWSPHKLSALREIQRAKQEKRTRKAHGLKEDRKNKEANRIPRARGSLLRLLLLPRCPNSPPPVEPSFRIGCFARTTRLHTPLWVAWQEYL